VTVTDVPELAELASSADRFLGAVRALGDDDVLGASALPGWTRAHLLTHVAQAADSRTGMLRAARAGQVGEQYPSEQARADAIEAGARHPAAVIRADVDRAVRECLAAMREHPAELWDAPAIWLRGGRGPVRGTVASLRSELEFHHVDLAAGYGPDDWPAEFVATELRRVTALMDRRADAPAVTLIATGAAAAAGTGAATVRVAAAPPADVTGPPAAILAWLSGRGDGSGLDAGAAGLPPLPPLA
jgi:maleylpyruvate isomerase